MSHIISGAMHIVLLFFLGGCVMHETYGTHITTESESAHVQGYWHYRFLYDEELHIVTVDGKREGKIPDWPYAYSVSFPAGKHWLQLALLRNSQTITMCTLEETFQPRHHYKLESLHHDQFLLAHPSSPLFPASITVIVSTPSQPDHHLIIPVVCGKNPINRQNSD